MNNGENSFFENQSLFILDGDTLDILDANEQAVERYGYSLDVLRTMNLRDIGSEKDSFDVEDLAIPGNRLWTLHTKNGERVNVQFTSHLFNYKNKVARMAVAHEVTDLIEHQVRDYSRYPKYLTSQSEYPLAEIAWNEDLEIEEWSRKAEDIFGWKAEEVVGKEDFFSEFVHESEIDDAFQTIDTAIESQQPQYTSEGKVITKKGKVLYCRWFNSLKFDQDGNLDSIRSLITDVSRQKESENLFKKLAEESMVGVYLIQDGAFKYVNPHFAKIFGYEKNEIINNISPLDLAHPDNRDEVKSNLEKRMSGELESAQEEFKGITQDGSTKHLCTYGFSIRYEGESAVAGSLLDVTKDKQALRRYQASLESYRDLFDSISDAIYIQDKDGRFLEVNEGAEEMYGYEKDYFVGKTPKFLAAPGKVDLAKTQRLVKRALEGESQTFRWWGKRKNGEVFPKEVTLNAGTYFSKDVVIAIGRDISDQYKAEEELRKNEELFRQLFQNSPVPISLLDARNEVRRVNAAFEETFGYSSDELEGLDIDEVIVPEEEADSASKISKKTFEGNTSSTSGTRLAKDGSEVEVMIYGVPVIVEDKTIAIYGIYVDVTDRVQAENKVKRSLREKEVLLAEIHHRVKNNLAVITGLLELQSYNTDSPDALNALKASQMRINSIALIHEKLYQSDNLSEISFDTYLRELVNVIIKSLETDHTDVSIDIASDPVDLTIGQAIPFGLILNELITNAYKHAFEGRREGNIDINIENKDGHIYLVVADNGVGIPENVSLQKPDSLGIKLIRTLSRQLDGDATFKSPDTGTRFTLRFELK